MDAKIQFNKWYKKGGLLFSSLEWKYILKYKTIQLDGNSVYSQTPEAGSIDTDSHYLVKHQGCGVSAAYK